MGGHRLDNGQKAHRLEAQPLKQTPRGAAPERGEWLNHMIQLLNTDPDSENPVDRAMDAMVPRKRVSQAHFAPKHIKNLLRRRSERPFITDMDIKGRVAQRKIANGRPFYQILQQPDVGASSTYRVNCLGDDSVEHAPAKEFDKWENADPQLLQKTPKKKRRSRAPLSASTFSGLPQPTFHNMLDIGRDIPHLVPKKTKSRHSRQISEAKLNASHLPALTRLRNSNEHGNAESAVLQTGEERGARMAHRTKTDRIERTSLQPAGSHDPAGVPHPTSGFGGPQLRGRTRASVGLTHINTGKQLAPQARERVLTPNLSVVPSSEVLSPDDPSEQPEWRSPTTQESPQSSTVAPSTMVSPISTEACKNQPSGCPTPAPNGPLPPLPEQQIAKGSPRRSRPIVVASDVMPTPTASPQKGSPPKPVASPGALKPRLDVFPPKSSARSEAHEDMPREQQFIPNSAISAPRGVSLQGETSKTEPRRLGDPFQHRMSKIKAIKQRDLQMNKACKFSTADESEHEPTLKSSRGPDVEGLSSSASGDLACEMTASFPLPSKRHVPESTGQNDAHMPSLQWNSFSPIITVAEVQPSTVAHTGRASSPPPRALALPRTTYRSHSTQYSPVHLSSRIASGSSTYSQYPDAVAVSTASLTHTGDYLPQNSWEDAVSVVDPHRHKTAPLETPKRSPQRVPWDRRPIDAKSYDRPLRARPLDHPVHAREAVDQSEGHQNGVQQVGKTLEARLRAFEVKTELLEAALLTVIDKSARIRAGLSVGSESEEGLPGLTAQQDGSRVAN